MDSRPLPACIADGRPLPSINDQSTKKTVSKNTDILAKLAPPDRLLPVTKTHRKGSATLDIPPTNASTAEHELATLNGPTTPIYGDPETHKVEQLREGYFKAKSRADEYLALVAAEKESLSARGWVPGKGDTISADLYTFKNRSAEKKQQFHQANRLYYGLSTLLYASIGAMKANELDVYVRRKALLLPQSIFDILEWEQFLALAKECRSKEWRDAYNKAADAAVPDKKSEDKCIDQKVSLSMRGCKEGIKNLKLEVESTAQEVQDLARDFSLYMVGAKKKMTDAFMLLNKKLAETNKSYQAALALVEVEKERNRHLQREANEKIQLDTLYSQEEFSDKLLMLKKEYESKFLEEESQLKLVTKENEDLMAIGVENSAHREALETKLARLESLHNADQERLRKYEEAELVWTSNPIARSTSKTDDGSGGTKAPQQFSEEEKGHFKRVKERVVALESTLDKQGSTTSQKSFSSSADENTRRESKDSDVVVIKPSREEQVALRVEQMRRENAEKEEQDRIEENLVMAEAQRRIDSKLAESAKAVAVQNEKEIERLREERINAATKKLEEEAMEVAREALRIIEVKKREERAILMEQMRKEEEMREARKKLEEEEDERNRIEDEKIASEIIQREERAKMARKKTEEEERNVEVEAAITTAQQEKEEEEKERLEDEKRVAAWKILEAQREKEEILGEEFKAKELVRRQSMVISDDVEEMVGAEPVVVTAEEDDSDEDEGADADADTWNEFISLEEFDGDKKVIVTSEKDGEKSDPDNFDGRIMTRRHSAAKIQRAKKRAEEKRDGWVVDPSDLAHAKKDSTESLVALTDESPLAASSATAASVAVGETSITEAVVDTGLASVSMRGGHEMTPDEVEDQPTMSNPDSTSGEAAKTVKSDMEGTKDESPTDIYQENEISRSDSLYAPSALPESVDQESASASSTSEDEQKSQGMPPMCKKISATDLDMGVMKSDTSILRSIIKSISPSKMTAKESDRDMQRLKEAMEEQEREAHLRDSKNGIKREPSADVKLQKALEKAKRREDAIKANMERERIHREVGYRILSVREDGPAARGHMEAQVDLIVAVRGLRLRVLDNSLIDAIKGSEDQPLPLTVYNCNTKLEREIDLIPTRKWNGEGLLGATVRFEGFHEEPASSIPAPALTTDAK